MSRSSEVAVAFVSRLWRSLSARVVTVAVTLVLAGCGSEPTSPMSDGFKSPSSQPPLRAAITGAGWNWTGPGTATVTPAAMPQDTFTYHLDVPGEESLSTWTFSSTSPATTLYTFNWTYSGFHGWFLDWTRVVVWMDTPLGQDSVVLVQTPTCEGCTGEIDGPFAFNGTHTIQVHAGMGWGVRITGDNYDSGGALSGTLVIANAVPPNVAPVIDVFTVPVSAAEGETAYFAASASDADGDSLTYSWNFGDNTAGVGPSVTHTYSSLGTFPVTLTVTDAYGNTATSSSSVVVFPRITVNVLPAVAGETCENTVIARSTTSTGFHVQLAQQQQSGACTAEFDDLVAGQEYVFSVRNTVIGLASDFNIWPDADGVPTDGTLPNRQDAVFVDGSPGTSAALTPPNYYAAIAAAQALTGSRSITIEFQPAGSTIECTLAGTTSPALVYAMVALDPAQVPVNPNPLDEPALGLYVAETGANGDGCVIQSVPGDETVIIEAEDSDGNTYRGTVAPGEDEVTLTEDPDFDGVGYLIDPWGDNAGGADDVGLVRFGLLNPGMSALSSAGGVFALKADFRAVRGRGEAKLEVRLSNIGGAGGSGLTVRVHCNKQTGACKMSQVLPGNLRSRVLGIEGSYDPATGQGWVSVQVDFAGATSADIAVIAGDGRSLDLAPDGGGVVQWTHGGGNSFSVAF